METFLFCIHMNKVTNGNDEWQGCTDCHLAILLGEQVFLANLALSSQSCSSLKC